MAQYLLSVWHDESYVVDFTGEDAQRRVAQVGNFNEDLVNEDALLFAGGLQPSDSARVANYRDGNVGMKDGPYSATEVQMGGFWIIEAADSTAAEEWARRGAEACEGPVEVRPLQGA